MAKKTPTKSAPEPAGDREISVSAAEASSSSTSAPQPGYQVLARRYRSKDFGEVVGQDAIARTLQNAMRTGRTAHAYLFCGTRGVGKTSMARIFARALNATEDLTQQADVAKAIMQGQDIDVVEIDAASNRGIDNARDLISGAGLMPARGRYKIYIIDEVHMLTTPAFNALLKTMEEPPAHVKFILCTTEPQSVPATIQSRCQRFDFRSIPTAKIAEHLRDVLARERASAEERVVMQVARMANGSMRDALSLLERLLAAAVPDASGRAELSWSLLEDIFGLPDETLVERVVGAILANESAEALAAAHELLERGLSIERALDLCAERFRWILLARTCGKDTPLLEVAQETRDVVARMSEGCEPASLVHLIALCDAVAAKARDASAPAVLFDAAIVRMCLTEHFADAARLLASGGASGGPSGGGQQPGKAPPRAAEREVRPAVTSPTSGPSLGVVESKPDRTPPARTDAQPSQHVVLRPVTLKPVQRLASSPDAAPKESDADERAQPSTSVSAGQFWSELIARAERSPRDNAVLAGLVCRGWDGSTLLLAARAGEAGSGYVASSPDLVKSTVERLAGRPLAVQIELLASERPNTAPLVRGAIPQEIREHPIVRLATELFDASIVACTPRADAAKDADPPSSLAIESASLPLGDDLVHDHAEIDEHIAT
jgi:DNA polymerase-3 subunit gamma/tau